MKKKTNEGKEIKILEGFKGFDNKLACRNFQYEVGKEYKTKSDPVLCEKGFHFCENPFDVFGYHPPSESRYCAVKSFGEKTSEGSDKVATSHIKIGIEIGLKGMVEAGVKFILDKINWKDSAATNTGNRSAATNTGNRSAATNTGDQSAATNTGYQSAATNTGDQSAASVEGKESVAIAIGYQNKAKGSLGCWLVLSEWVNDENGNYHISSVKSARIDGKKIKADTWYMLTNKKFTEVK